MTFQSGVPVVSKPYIAVLDDELDLLDVYASFLEPFFNLSLCAHPTEFLNQLKKNGAPDVAVVDLCMPGMDGIQVVSHARAQGLAFPTILVSGRLDKDSVVKAFDSGIMRILEKPVDLNKLLAYSQELSLEHKVFKIRREILSLTYQLRELYTGLRMLAAHAGQGETLRSPVLPGSFARNGADGQPRLTDAMAEMEARLDALMKAEETLNDIRANKLSNVA